MPRTLVIPDRLAIDCTSTLTQSEREAGKKFRVEFDMTGASGDLDNTTFGKGLMLWAGHALRTLKKRNNVMWRKCYEEQAISVKYADCGKRTVAPKVPPMEAILADVLAGKITPEEVAETLAKMAEAIQAKQNAADEVELDEALEEIEGSESEDSEDFESEAELEQAA